MLKDSKGNYYEDLGDLGFLPVAALIGGASKGLLKKLGKKKKKKKDNPPQATPAPAPAPAPNKPSPWMFVAGGLALMMMFGGIVLVARK